MEHQVLAHGGFVDPGDLSLPNDPCGATCRSPPLVLCRPHALLVAVVCSLQVAACSCRLLWNGGLPLPPAASRCLARRRLHVAVRQPRGRHLSSRKHCLSLRCACSCADDDRREDGLLLRNLCQVLPPGALPIPPNHPPGPAFSGSLRLTRLRRVPSLSLLSTRRGCPKSLPAPTLTASSRPAAPLLHSTTWRSRPTSSGRSSSATKVWPPSTAQQPAHAKYLRVR